MYMYMYLSAVIRGAWDNPVFLTRCSNSRDRIVFCQAFYEMLGKLLPHLLLSDTVFCPGVLSSYQLVSRLLFKVQTSWGASGCFQVLPGRCVKHRVVNAIILSHRWFTDSRVHVDSLVTVLFLLNTYVLCWLVFWVIADFLSFVSRFEGVLTLRYSAGYEMS